MADPEAIVEFPGIDSIVSMSGTLAHGITPGVFQITCAPQKKKPTTVGTLKLRYDSFKKEFKDCKIVTSSYQYNESGEIVSLNILDRRWKWAYGSISGIYNVRLDDGSLLQKEKGSKLAVLDTERKPQDLAKLLLDAMQEPGYEAGELPNDPRPTCEWDYVTPARALADLCEMLGSRVVLQTTGKVKLCKTGKGKELSATLPYDSYGQQVDLSSVPENIMVIGDRVLWQVDIELEAVGEDTDETIKKLDDLSYKPTEGWTSNTALRTFGGIADETSRGLAVKSVYRMYRIKGPIELPGTPPGVEKTVKNLDLILPLVNSRGETKTDPDTKKKIPYPAVVYGKFAPELDAKPESTPNNIPAAPKPGTEDIKKQIVPGGFSLDETRGIVTFGSPVYLKEDSKPEPAKLYLRCCVALRSEKTGQFYRYEHNKKVGQAKTPEPPLLLRHPEIAVLVKRDKSSNQDDAQKEANYYIDAKVKEFKENKPQVVEYTGWHDVELDGAIQSISWSMSQGGAKMVAQRDIDQGSPTTEPYKVLRNIEAIKKSKEDAELVIRNRQKRTEELNRGWAAL